MKTKIFIILILLFSGCNDKLDYRLNDYILAGQKDGAGIEYVDLIPDINCTIVDPWKKVDTTLNLDLNKDGINDFSFEGNMYDPGMLGMDFESIKIIPLLSNEVCINPETYWLDTLSYSDTISADNNWTNDEALIYSYYWNMPVHTSIKGYWKGVQAADRYYIGFKIISNNKIFYGWIGMKDDPDAWPFNFKLTDYAIIKVYAK